MGEYLDKVSILPLVTASKVSTLVEYLDKFKVTVADTQSSAGTIADSITMLNICFAEDTVKMSYAESYWTKEIHQEH